MRKLLLANNMLGCYITKWHRCLGGAIFVFICGSLLSQPLNPNFSAGTEFWTVYTNHTANGWLAKPDTSSAKIYNYNNYIYLIGVNHFSCVNISIPSLNFKQVIPVDQNELKTVKLPANPVYTLDTMVEPSIHISATSPIMVIQGQNTDTLKPWRERYIFNAPNFLYDLKINSTEASMVTPSGHVPATNQKTPLIYASARRINELSGLTRARATEMSIVSLEEGNQVRLALDQGTFDIKRQYQNNFNKTLEFTLNKGRQYRLRPASDHLHSGSDSTQVSSINAKPLKYYLFSEELHHDPYNSTSNDFAYEELVLPNILGRSFHIPPLQGYKGHTISVHALHPNTVLNFNNEKTIVLDSLQRLDTVIREGKHLSATKPLALYGACQSTQFSNYPTVNNNYDAFFSVILPGDNKQLSHSHFSTLGASDSNNHYMLALTTRSRDTAATTLDGNPLPSGSFELFSADSSWSYALVEVNRGVHQVRNPNGFNGFHYTYYKDPKGRKDLVTSNYGYNLAQSVIWPEDSFAAKAGPSPQQLRSFADLSNPVLCPGDSFYFRAPNLHNTTWQWRIGADTAFSQPTGNGAAPTIGHHFEESGTYSVILNDASGCHPSDTLVITVGSGKPVSFDYNKRLICRGYRINLASEGLVDSLRWIFPGSTDEQDTAVSFRYTGDKKVIAVKMIGYTKGCVDTLSRAITLREEEEKPMQIPNFISPNNDGINDAFCLPQAELLQGCYELQIYNRYGRQVFASQDPNECWKARSVTTGVYFYTLQIAGRSYQGSLHVNL